MITIQQVDVSVPQTYQQEIFLRTNAKRVHYGLKCRVKDNIGALPVFKNPERSIDTQVDTSLRDSVNVGARPSLEKALLFEPLPKQTYLIRDWNGSQSCNFAQTGVV